MANELSARETALRNANRHLNSLASLDALTGIPNRRSFDAVLPLQWNKAPQLALLMIDIDNFKLYNDHYGHKEGDRCIRSVAQALATTVRGSDVIARIGGEEFAVLMPDADIGTAADVADRLRRAVEALAIPHANAAGVVTVSVGAAACQPAPSLSPSELFVAADQALYAAKRAGRNGVRRADAPALHGVASSPEEGRPGGGTDAGG
nr:diguanylate cyclase [Ancylobacter tetraedralis]